MTSKTRIEVPAGDKFSVEGPVTLHVERAEPKGYARAATVYMPFPVGSAVRIKSGIAVGTKVSLGRNARGKKVATRMTARQAALNGMIATVASYNPTGSVNLSVGGVTLDWAWATSWLTKVA